MQVTEETKALAQQISDYFLVYPERHEQDTWVWLGDNDGETYLRVEEELTEQNVCNTTMCIAGSAVFMTRSLDEFKKFHANAAHTYDNEAGKLLGLNLREGQWLFYETNNEEALDAVRAIANGDVDKFTAMIPEDFEV